MQVEVWEQRAVAAMERSDIEGYSLDVAALHRGYGSLEEAEQLCRHVAIIDHGEIIEHADMKSLINRLDVQTLVLDIDKPLPAQFRLDHFHYRIVDKTTIEVEVHKNQSINHLFQLLSQQDLAVNSLRNKTNRLEELFIYLVSAKKQ